MAYCCAGSPWGHAGAFLIHCLAACSHDMAVPPVLYKAAPLQAFLLSNIAALLFYGNSTLGQPIPHELPLDESILLTSSISGLSETNEMIRFLAEDPSGSASIQVTYFKQDDQERLPGLTTGAICTMKGSPAHPDAATNPGQFDHRHYLKQQGVFYELELQNLEDITCTGSSPFSQLSKARAAFLHEAGERLDPETAAWVQAMIAGEDSNLNEETINLFNRWSLSHILAISGMHIALFSAILHFVLTKLQILTVEKSFGFCSFSWVYIQFLPEASHPYGVRL